MNSNGTGTATDLTNNSFSDIDPSWSPEGDKIIFQSFRNGIFDIYVMDSDGNNQTNLTNNSSTDSYPAWGSNTTVLNSIPVANDDNTTTVSTPSILTTTVNTQLLISDSEILSNDSDQDVGDTISVSSVTTPSSNGGTVSFTSNTITYNPPTDFVGFDQITYEITDGVATDSAIISVIVNDIPSPLATDLGTLGGTSSFGDDINELDQVVGFSEISGGFNHAFIWDSTN